MKKLFFVLCVSILMWSCGPGGAKKNVEPEVPVVTDEVVATMDQLLASPDMYLDKEVSLTGLCVKTCPCGKKLFLTGTDETKFVVVLPTGDEKFDADLKGLNLTVKGTLSKFDKESACKGEGEGEDKAEQQEGQECEAMEILYQLTCVSFTVVAEAEAEPANE